MADDEHDEGGSADGKEDEVAPSVDVHFEPIIRLEEVEVKTLEENEDVEFKIRAKLYRYDKTSKEWKERGTGEVRFLKHRENKKVRLVMRRDKTLKVCANHFVKPEMELTANVSSDRSWVYKALDFSEGAPEFELFAIKFANTENAAQFKEEFLKHQTANKAIFDTEKPEAETKA